MKEFTNNLTKYNFKMDEIKLFDAFAGIGALHQSLKELGVPVKITGLSEIDVDVIIEYAGVHIDNFINFNFDYPSEDDMRKWLMNRNIGWSFEKNKSSIPRLKKDKLYSVYKASVLLNNLGDISKINCNDIEDFDLFNLSFACTDISNAGKQKGFKNEDGTTTRSGLVT
jgi:DNA (cytosine-5)-methyltransferase 1